MDDTRGKVKTERVEVPGPILLNFREFEVQLSLYKGSSNGVPKGRVVWYPLVRPEFDEVSIMDNPLRSLFSDVPALYNIFPGSRACTAANYFFRAMLGMQDRGPKCMWIKLESPCNIREH